jgi:LacI family transcriptional regulator
MADTMALLERHHIPFVNTFNHDAGTGCRSIGPDNRRAVRLLTRHLMDLGHRRFGMIAQSIRNNDRATPRLQGVRDALAEAGLSVRPQHFTEGEWGIGEARGLFRTILASKPWPTAISCGNAFLAVGAVLEATCQGITLPDDMSIVGYDDVEIMQERPGPITTLRVRSDEVGRRAATYLVATITGQPAEVELECEVEIVTRASSGPPRRPARKC